MGSSDLIRACIRALLVEGRIDDASAAWAAGGGSPGTFRDIVAAQPLKSSNKFLGWTVRTILGDPQLGADIDAIGLDVVFNLLKEFESVVEFLPRERRDISGYSSFKELSDVVHDASGARSEALSARVGPGDVDRVWEGGGIIVVRPRTMGAAIKYGKGTKWCISGLQHNKFEDYADEGSVHFFVIDRSPLAEGDEMSRIAVTVREDGEEEFHDARDRDIDESLVRLHLGAERWDEIRRAIGTNLRPRASHT